MFVNTAGSIQPFFLILWGCPMHLIYSSSCKAPHRMYTISIAVRYEGQGFESKNHTFNWKALTP